LKVFNFQKRDRIDVFKWIYIERSLWHYSVN
jgi:hypothetical protein